jgi:hypothetical protein
VTGAGVTAGPASAQPADKPLRPWCAQAEYPGLRRFYVGTVNLPHDTPSHEIETALSLHALTFLPEGFRLVGIECGALFFSPEGDE